MKSAITLKKALSLRLKNSILYKIHEVLHRAESSKIASVGKYTYGVENITTRYSNEGSLHVGAFCSIADRVTVFLGGGHNTQTISTYPFGLTDTLTGWESDGFQFTNNASRGDVRIGNDVWIGSGVTIMSGVTIGNGSVVAANSHVVKDVQPYAIVGGNPAHVIRERFSVEITKDLQQIAWWEWPDEAIVSAQNLLCSIPDEFVLKLLNQIKNALHG